MEKQDTQPNSNQDRGFDADKVLTETFGAGYHGPSSSDGENQTVDESAVDENQIDSEAVSQETEVQEHVDENQISEGQGESEEAQTSLREFLTANEIDPEVAKSLTFDVMVNGETAQVPIIDMADSYQIREAAEAELSQNKEKTGQIVAELTKRADDIEALGAHVEQLAAYGEQMILRDFQDVTDELRDTDPGMWAARRQERQAREREIDALRQSAGHSLETLRQQSAAQFQEQQKEVVKAEQVKLLELVPEWKDQSVQEREKAELTDYLINKLGFPQEDVANVTSASLVAMARNSMLYENDQHQKSAAKKKVATAPRVMKPGAPKSSQQHAQDKIDALKARAHKSGSIEDAAAWLAAERGAT